MKASLVLSTLAILLTQSACQQGIDSSGGQNAPSVSGYLDINSTAPANNQNNVYLDAPVEIGFDGKIDAPSVHASQIEVWTAQGSKVPWSQLQVGGRFVGDKSILKIASKSEWLPLTTYYVALRGVPPDSSTDPVLTGIRSINGDPLLPTSITFTTGSSYRSGSSDSFQVRAIAPGRLLVNGQNVDSGSTFGDMFSDATTVVNNNDIKISFSSPVRHFAVDSYASPLTPEIPKTPIDRVSGLTIAVLDSRTSVADFMANIPSDTTNILAWNNWLSRVRTLKGYVHTENSRRLMVFELETNCPNKEDCTYPDNTDVANIGQVVVVVIKGFVSVVHNQPLKNEPIIGSFVHISGYRAGDGYPGAGAALGGAIKGIFSP